jgi:hypothetical protein
VQREIAWKAWKWGIHSFWATVRVISGSFSASKKLHTVVPDHVMRQTCKSTLVGTAPGYVYQRTFLCTAGHIQLAADAIPAGISPVVLMFAAMGDHPLL